MEIKEQMKASQELRIRSSSQYDRSSHLKLKTTALKTIGYKQVEAQLLKPSDERTFLDLQWLQSFLRVQPFIQQFNKKLDSKHYKIVLDLLSKSVCLGKCTRGQFLFRHPDKIDQVCIIQQGQINVLFSKQSEQIQEEKAILQRIPLPKDLRKNCFPKSSQNITEEKEGRNGAQQANKRRSVRLSFNSGRRSISVFPEGDLQNVLSILRGTQEKNKLRKGITIEKTQRKDSNDSRNTNEVVLSYSQQDQNGINQVNFPSTTSIRFGAEGLRRLQNQQLQPKEKRLIEDQLNLISSLSLDKEGTNSNDNRPLISDKSIEKYVFDGLVMRFERQKVFCKDDMLEGQFQAAALCTEDCEYLFFSRSVYSKILRFIAAAKLNKKLNRLSNSLDQSIPSLRQFLSRLVVPFLKKVKLSQGMELFKEGDPVTHCYVIISGEIEIFKLKSNTNISSLGILSSSPSKQQTQIKLATFTQGQYVGEEELIQQLSNRSYSGVSKSLCCKLYSIQKDVFLKLLVKCQDLKVAFQTAVKQRQEYNQQRLQNMSLQAHSNANTNSSNTTNVECPLSPQTCQLQKYHLSKQKLSIKERIKQFLNESSQKTVLNPKKRSQSSSSPVKLPSEGNNFFQISYYTAERETKNDWKRITGKQLATSIQKNKSFTQPSADQRLSSRDRSIRKWMKSQADEEKESQSIIADAVSLVTQRSFSNESHLTTLSSTSAIFTEKQNEDITITQRLTKFRSILQKIPQVEGNKNISQNKLSSNYCVSSTGIQQKSKASSTNIVLLNQILKRNSQNGFNSSFISDRFQKKQKTESQPLTEMNKNNSDFFNHVVFVNHMGQPRNYYMLNPRKTECNSNCTKASNISIGKLEK